MSIHIEYVQQASTIFFQLLRRKMIPNQDHLLTAFFEQDEVREALKVMADEAGVMIVQAPSHVHLVARAEGSVFATSFTQMRKRYTDIESKKYFYLMNVILLVFLAEVDVEAARRMRAETNGVSYYQLEKQVHAVLMRWKQEQLVSATAFSANWGIAIEEIAELWETMAVDDDSDKEGRLIGTRKTHIGLIHMAIRTIRDENLVYISEDEKRIIPRNELYERMEAIYHQQDRYQAMKAAIAQAFTTTEETEDNPNAAY
ncbi:hypothetical protein EHS13_04190 [Paenibacillus psychroresistens]|uniref:Non-ribosomal peptide synthetase module n=1 Tax=Paenibacillus psychroresistens TaxID=1778678 RepID=A0A6B8RFA4_9BACL|nr:DUF6063 family protein [Paenibacillus psychroresistens]QGQ94162.1 hypothetical protein EHS13_04190 [Paenibacillus psychroresistens]